MNCLDFIRNLSSGFFITTASFFKDLLTKVLAPMKQREPNFILCEINDPPAINVLEPTMQEPRKSMVVRNESLR